MKSATVRSNWLPKGGFRLDCSPYLGGAIETEILLEELPVRKDRLGNVTRAIFNGPKFSRTYVDDPEYGVPFIGGSAMQQADLSHLPLLSKSQAHGKQLRDLEIKKGMTLITCSGTIGKMAYARAEMEGIWSSQHVMKVVPNENLIPSGYLYAFLSSKFGVPLIVSGTYGSIIQSIEPHHISGLSVPRFGDALEHEIHELVEEAARLRSEASGLKKDAICLFEDRCGIPEARPLKSYPSPMYGKASSRMLEVRMDSTYFIPPCMEARSAFDAAGSNRPVGEVADVFIPGIFKRQYSSSSEFGYSYITGADVFCIKPESDQNLIKSVAESYRLVLEEGMILIHEAGQRYGLIGNAVMVGQTLAGFACTNNMVRVMPKEAAEAGYIYSVFSSEHGVRLLKREAAGSSIPHLDDSRVRKLHIPWPEDSVRNEISTVMHRARSNWDDADERENKAVELLADAILNR
jgi:type I restriction enzyme, S subunit